MLVFTSPAFVTPSPGLEEELQGATRPLLQPANPQHGIAHEELAHRPRQIPPVFPPLPREFDGAPVHAGVHGEAAAGRDSEVTWRWPCGAEGQPEACSCGGHGLGQARGAACKRQIAVPRQPPRL